MNEKSSNSLSCKDLFETGKIEDALECFNKELSIDSEHIPSLYLKARALLYLNRFGESLIVFNKLLKTNPQNIKDHYIKVSTLCYLRKYKEAMDYFNQIPQVNANDPNDLHSKGLALSYLGKHQEALNCFDAALEIDQNNAVFWRAKGIALSDMGKYRESILAFKEALRINPTNIRTLCFKGIALRKILDYDKAIGCFNLALSINSNFIMALDNMGITLSIVGEHSEALKCFETVFRIDPTNIHIRLSIAEELISLGNKDKARSICDFILKEKILDEDTYSGLMILYSKMEYYDKVDEVFDLAMDNINRILSYIQDYDRSDYSDKSYGDVIHIPPIEDTANILKKLSSIYMEIKNSQIKTKDKKIETLEKKINSNETNKTFEGKLDALLIFNTQHGKKIDDINIKLDQLDHFVRAQFKLMTLNIKEIRNSQSSLEEKIKLIFETTYEFSKIINEKNSEKFELKKEELRERLLS